MSKVYLSLKKSIQGFWGIPPTVKFSTGGTLGSFNPGHESKIPSFLKKLAYTVLYLCQGLQSENTEFFIALLGSK